MPVRASDTVSDSETATDDDKTKTVSDPSREEGREEGKAVSAVGALLQASRQRAGEELSDVSRLLRINRRYLQAIEDGDMTALPGTAYALGFVRAYADHLGLDSGEIVRRFKLEVAATQAPAELVFPSPIPENGIPGGTILVFGALIAALAYGGWYYMTNKKTADAMVQPVPSRLAGDVGIASDAPLPQMDAPVTKSAPTSPAPTPTPVPAPAPTISTSTPSAPPADGTKVSSTPLSTKTPAPPVPSSTSTPSTQTQTQAPAPAISPSHGTVSSEPAPGASSSSAVSTAPSSTAPSSTAPAPTTAEKAASAASESVPSSAPTSTSSPVPAPKAPTAPKGAPAVKTPSVPASVGQVSAQEPSRITVHAKANSWIQVRDEKANKTLFTRLLRAGAQYRVPDRPGLRLVTGNAGALEITVDGKPVPSIGAEGTVRQDVLLDPDRLKAGTAVMN